MNLNDILRTTLVDIDVCIVCIARTWLALVFAARRYS